MAKPAAHVRPRRTVGVLALQGDFREHREVLESLGHTVVEVRRPAQLDELDALIVPGGESTTIARLILSNGFQQPLRDFCSSGRPVWGTCAGAILLAKHVDNLDRPGIEVMEMRVQRNAFGRQVDSFEADLDIKGLEGAPFHAVFIRAPIFESVSRPAGVVARLEDGAIVAARQGNLLATSFHPELTGDTRLHEYFLSIGSLTNSQSRDREGARQGSREAEEQRGREAGTGNREPGTGSHSERLRAKPSCDREGATAGPNEYSQPHGEAAS